MDSRIVDLSLPIFHEMPVHPEDPRIGFVSFSRISVHGWNETQLLLSTHGGSHMDAPYHFIESGIGIDQVDLHKCVGRAQVIDLRGLAAERDLVISDLRPHEDLIRPGARLLFRTDWYKTFPDQRYYTDFNGISPELARWLADKGIVLIGVETFAVHPKEYETVHKAFLSKEIVIVEGLANLDRLESQEILFIALPLRLERLDGSPVRAIAIEESVDH